MKICPVRDEQFHANGHRHTWWSIWSLIAIFRMHLKMRNILTTQPTMVSATVVLRHLKYAFNYISFLQYLVVQL